MNLNNTCVNTTQLHDQTVIYVYFPNNQLFVGTQQQDEAIKSRGIKLKEKKVSESERSIGSKGI
jgi:hypothetical protein